MYIQKIKEQKIDKLERAKILFQFVLMTVCAVVIGAIFASKCSGELFLEAQGAISSHFEKVFVDHVNISDIILSILRYSASDIATILVVFLVSFAVCNYTATDIALVACGLRYGFSISFLSEYLYNDLLSYNVNILQFLIFVLFKSVALLLIAHYAYYAAVSSGLMKYRSSYGRFTIRFSSFLPFLAVTLAHVGAIVITDGTYCWLLYLLK